MSAAAVANLARLVERARQEPELEEASFDVFEVNLADLSTDSWKSYRESGYGLEFPLGTTPGVVLEARGPGLGHLAELAPGQGVRAFFNSIELRRKGSTPATGTVYLVVIKSPLAKLTQRQNANGPAAPVALLGSVSASGAISYVAVAENTQPTGAPASMIGAFYVAGWKKLRLTLNATGLTTVTLVPWTYRGGNVSGDSTAGAWAEQGLERIDVPDSQASGYATRSVVVSVAGPGWHFFEVRDLLPGALTALNQLAEGIE